MVALTSLAILVIAWSSAAAFAADPADKGVPASRDGGADTSAAWQRARAEADRPHVDELLDARTLAAVGGLAWFWLVVRSRRRAAARQRPASG